MRAINSQTKNKIAEVIEASTAQFTAQCYELYKLPPLGGLVMTGDIYGIVAGAMTESLEPGRKPIARGREEVSEEAIYQSSPQLAKLLRSEFTVVVVGYKDGGTIRQYLPPYPARIHSFIYLCKPEEVSEFSQRFDFLTIVVNAALSISTDELIAAALRQMGQAQEDNRAFLVAAGKELANLLSSRYDQLKSILGRISP